MVAISVIVSAYNNFTALVRALPFYQQQTETAFELVIADDGSNAEQTSRFHHAAEQTSLRIRHVWHEDQGFDKCGILNKAITVAGAERLLFTDADMVPRFDLIANHLKLLRRNYFISGGSHIDLNESGQALLSEQKSEQQKVDLFCSSLLCSGGHIARKKAGRLARQGVHARFYDLLTYRANAFSGANASCWKQDALAVNGFDEGWGYGGLDRDFGIRLTNYGIKSRRHQYSLVALHQDHPRPYRDAEQVKQNKQQLLARMKSGISRIDSGLDQHQAEDIQIIWSQHDSLS